MFAEAQIAQHNYYNYNYNDSDSYSYYNYQHRVSYFSFL